LLFLLLALAYAHWFFRLAKRQNKSQPVVWGILGFLTFFLPALLAMWAASALNSPKLIASANTSGVLRPEFIIPFIVDTASALIIANGISLIVRKIYLDPSWNFKTAKDATARRQTFALPGGFPWFFVFVYAALSLISVMVTTTLDPPPPPDRYTPMPSLDNYNWRFLSIIIQTAGIALLLWRFKGWLQIAIGWAAIHTFIMLCFFLVLMLKIEVFQPSLFSSLPVKFAFVFAVRRWGAALPVLLVAHLGAKLLADLPFIVTVGHKNIFEFLSPQFTGLFLVLSLYVTFLFYRPQTSDQKQ
jgi:hypothetical protein